MARTCDRVDCHEPALWKPVLLLYAPAQYGKRPPVRGELNLALCTKHKEEATVADVLTDEGWQVIVELARKQGKVPPVRSRTRLEFVAPS